MDNEIHLIPLTIAVQTGQLKEVDGELLEIIEQTEVRNHYIDVVELMEAREHIYVFREGQTPEEFWAELEAAKVREQYGLPPGRTMPTEAEIDAGPPPPPLPEPDPRDVKIAGLEARLAALEIATRK